MKEGVKVHSVCTLNPAMTATNENDEKEAPTMMAEYSAGFSVLLRATFPATLLVPVV